VLFKPDIRNVGEEYEESYHLSIEAMDKKVKMLKEQGYDGGLYLGLSSTIRSTLLVQTTKTLQHPLLNHALEPCSQR